MSASLASIKTETLCLCGELDLLSPPSHVAATLGALPNAHFKTIPDAAHSLHWDQPERFAEEICAFFQ